MKITQSNEPAPQSHWKIEVQYLTGYKGELLARFATKQKADAYGNKYFKTDSVVYWKSVEEPYGQRSGI
jgi:hypothetical protein